ncbi:hypothetical protein SAMN05216282_11015 [Cryobacterium psychrotolerans]|uniref:Uncharacterized protein n=1 Tax=Cryobacterium psychrotolerans TaxID=386301 RepID=A0A1G9DS77_9MICO|nr:hypothetical protein SAMN05216282_11015 [Cryobacterium psychrotolerans]
MPALWFRYRTDDEAGIGLRYLRLPFSIPPQLPRTGNAVR